MTGPLLVVKDYIITVVTATTNERALHLLRYINRRLVSSCIIMDQFLYASLFPHHHCLYNIDNIDVLCVVCAIQKASGSVTRTVVLEINIIYNIDYSTRQVNKER